MLQEALLPLVPALGTDPILPAQLPEVLRSQRPHYKLNSLVHRIHLFPWHPQLLSQSSADLLPMS